MKTRLKATLETAIWKWVEDHLEDDDWPDCWIYDDLDADMAEAAGRVFDASVKGQRFAEEKEAE